MAKFDPFLSLDCVRVEGVGAESKERMGSNFAAQHSGAIVQNPEGPNTYNLKIWLLTSGNLELETGGGPAGAAIGPAVAAAAVAVVVTVDAAVGRRGGGRLGGTKIFEFLRPKIQGIWHSDFLWSAIRNPIQNGPELLIALPN